MKKISLLVTLLLVGLFTASAQGKFSGWPEMKAFHEVLAHTVHPAEEGDMEPIRTRSHELFASCKQLNIAPVPAPYNTERMRNTLKRMEKETDRLNAACVRQEQSGTIMKKLKTVHDTFHEVMGMCDDNKSTMAEGNPVKHNE